MGISKSLVSQIIAMAILAFLVIFSIGALNAAATENSSQIFGPYPDADPLCNTFSLAGCKLNPYYTVPGVKEFEQCQEECTDFHKDVCEFFTYNQTACQLYDHHNIDFFVTQCNQFGSPMEKQRDDCLNDPCKNYLHMDCKGFSSVQTVTDCEDRKFCQLLCQESFQVSCEYFVYDQEKKECYFYESDDLRECGSVVVAKDAEKFYNDLPCPF